MINPRELRIGNLVESNGFYFPKGTFELRSVPISEKVLDSLNPIPLTEEWLEKFGFIWNDFENDPPEWLVLKHGLSNLFYSDKSTDFSVVTFHHKILKEVKIKYVHQLQNLYFALTGTELKYNENQ